MVSTGRKTVKPDVKPPRQRRPQHAAGRLTKLRTTPESNAIRESVSDDLSLYYDVMEVNR
jgi:hypothetical protein